VCGFCLLTSCIWDFFPPIHVCNDADVPTHGTLKGKLVVGHMDPTDLLNWFSMALFVCVLFEV
jgi:hypothetical protein